MLKARTTKTATSIALGMLFILSCKAVQFNVQVNFDSTPAGTANVTDQTGTPSTILQTPTLTTMPLTGTPSSTPEALPRLLPGQTVQIGALKMLGDTTGWGSETGGHILHTLDGGRTWSDVTPPQFSYYTGSSFYAVDPNIAWAASIQPGGLRSWQTSDAGRSWQAGEAIHLGDIDTGKCGPLHFDQVSVPQIWFIDGTRGWMVVTADASEHAYMVSMLFSTTDAGTHWELKYLSTRDCSTSEGPEGLWSVLFRTPHDGWAGFFQNKFGYYPYNQERYVGGWDLYRTTDDGISWKAVNLPEPPGFLEETRKTENAQENATCGILQIVPLTHDVFGMQMRCFISPNHAFHYYYLTFNNGLDWTVWPSDGSEEFVVDPYRENKTTGWRFLRSTSGGLSEIQQTVDRGHTWSTIKKVAWDMASFDFIDEQTGWAIVTAGTNTMLLHTTNGGRTWKVVTPFVSP